MTIRKRFSAPGLALRASPLGRARGARREGHLFRPSATAAISALEAIPDLLHTEAVLSVEGPQLCGALDFAFAGGGCLETLEQALDSAPLAPSRWNPESYQGDLFIEDFVETCMEVTLGSWKAPLNKGFLVRFLSSPPADLAILHFRRAILTDLMEDESLKGSFESLYRLLVEMRQCFDISEIGSRHEGTRRRIETLSALRRALDKAREGFSGAPSGLVRIHRYAQMVGASEGFQQLVDLLEYENDLARVDLQLQLGSDGRVRRFEILRVRENAHNQFYSSPLRRLWGRICLLFRGYRFSKEELLDRWLDHVFDGVKHFIPPLLQLLGQMEVYLGALAFRDLCRAKGLPLCFPTLVDEGCQIRDLFNPLLFSQGVVPVTCSLGEESFGAITIVTGPNSGGKTRLLQALGLTQMLTQVGLLAPAREARLRPATGLFVSLMGIDPRADQREGRLGTELIRVRHMFETSSSGSLVLLDELCSGTNPSEGEEIFQLVLTLLSELGPEAFISTHFLDLTRRLSREQGKLNLSFLQVDLDKEQRPGYAFTPGVARTSLAAQTAARLGVTREELMALVRRNRGCDR